MIYAHPNLTAAAAIEVARRHGLVLVHEHVSGNYHYESTAARVADTARKSEMRPESAHPDPASAAGQHYPAATPASTKSGPSLLAAGVAPDPLEAA